MKKIKSHLGTATRVKLSTTPERQQYRFIVDLDPIRIDFHVVYGGPGTMSPQRFAEAMGVRISAVATLEDDPVSNSGVITLRDDANNALGSATCAGIFRHPSRPERTKVIGPSPGLLPIDDDPFNLPAR